MPDPTHFDQSILSDSDREYFLQSNEKKETADYENSEMKTLIGTFSVVKNEIGGLTLKSPDVDFLPNTKIDFKMMVEKVPTIVGQEMHRISIDYENFGLKMQEMITEAIELRQLPERDRPEKLLAILLKHMQYAYKDVIENLPDDGKGWVKENITVNSMAKSEKVPLSEIADNGVGVCRHLSVLLLVLAKEAGLEGAYETADLEFTNLARKDSDYQPNDGRPALFRSCGVNEKVSEGHAWVELKINDEGIPKWVPVDPSTQLVGDTPDRLATFKRAGYKTPAYIMPKFYSSKEVPSGINTGFKIDQMLDLGMDRQEIELSFANKPVEVFHFKKGSSVVEPERFTGDLMIDINPTENFFSGSKHIKIDSISYQT